MHRLRLASLRVLPRLLSGMVLARYLSRNRASEFANELSSHLPPRPPQPLATRVTEHDFHAPLSPISGQDALLVPSCRESAGFGHHPRGCDAAQLGKQGKAGHEREDTGVCGNDRRLPNVHLFFSAASARSTNSSPLDSCFRNDPKSPSGSSSIATRSG